MPDIQIGVQVVGASQAVGDLNNVGDAVSRAGSKSKAAGADFGSATKGLLGMAGGASLVTSGLFGMEDTLDGVAKADLRADKAHRTLTEALQKRNKIQQELNAVTSQGVQIQRNSNGEVSLSADTQERFAQTMADGTRWITNSNGELKMLAPTQSKSKNLAQDLADANRDVAIATEQDVYQTKQAAQAHERLIPNLAAQALQMGTGAAAIGTFAAQTIKAIRPTADLGASFRAAASSTSGTSTAVGGLTRVIGTAAGAIGGIVIAQRISNATGYSSAKMWSDLGKAVGDAVPQLKPALKVISEIGAQGIAGGNFVLKVLGLGQFEGDMKQAQETLSKASGEFEKARQATIRWIFKYVWPPIAAAVKDLEAFWGQVVLAYNATVNWLAKNVWPALVTAYADLRAFWGNVVTAYNATINWLTRNVWPAITAAYADLRAIWGNVVTAYNATVNWLTRNVWPALTTAYTDLRNVWGNVITAYNATVNWLVRSVWPALQQAYSSLIQTWGNVVTAYNATVNWLVRNVWPALQQAYSSLIQTWGNVVTTYNATVNWLVRNVWPALQSAYTSLTQAWGNVQTTYNATVNWAVKHVWPAINVVQASLVSFWGNLEFAYNVLINFAANFKWPDFSSIALPDLSGVGTRIWNALGAAVRAAAGGLGLGSFIKAATGGTFYLSGSTANRISQIVAAKKALEKSRGPVTSGTLPPIPTGGTATPSSGGHGFDIGGVHYDSLPPGTKVAGAAKGGSFIVDQPTMLGNIQVGEGHRPEMISILPVGGASNDALMVVTPLNRRNKRMADGGQALVSTSMFSGMNDSHGTRSNAGNNNDLSKLISLLQRLITIQSHGKSFEANLKIDGQKMASIAEKYIGSRSYGDL